MEWDFRILKTAQFESSAIVGFTCQDIPGYVKMIKQLLNMAIEIMDCPIKNDESFHNYVKLQKGMVWSFRQGLTSTNR